MGAAVLSGPILSPFDGLKTQICCLWQTQTQPSPRNSVSAAIWCHQQHGSTGGANFCQDEGFDGLPSCGHNLWFTASAGCPGTCENSWA